MLYDVVSAIYNGGYRIRLPLTMEKKELSIFPNILQKAEFLTVSRMLNFLKIFR